MHTVNKFYDIFFNLNWFLCCGLSLESSRQDMDIIIHTNIFIAGNSKMVIFNILCDYVIKKPPVSWRIIIHWLWLIAYDNWALFRVVFKPPLYRVSITHIEQYIHTMFRESIYIIYLPQLGYKMTCYIYQILAWSLLII